MILQTENINNKLEVLIKPFIESLSHREEVIGVALLGGLGKRSFSDKFSDIDLSVLLYDSKKDRFPLPFEFHYTYGDYIAEFNINTLLYEQELSIQWEHGKIEAYENARIVYDPNGKFKDLLTKKVVFDEKEAFERLVWIVQQYQWRAQIHSIRTFYRGYPEGAQYVLNVCLDMLIEGVFLLNKQYMPHCKWVFPKLKDLDHFGLYDRFLSCTLVNGFAINDVYMRLNVMDEIYNTLRNEIMKKYPDFPENPYEYFLKKKKNIHTETPIEVICRSNSAYCSLSHDEKLKIYGELCYRLIDEPEEANTFLNQIIKKNGINE